MFLEASLIVNLKYIDTMGYSSPIYTWYSNFLSSHPCLTGFLSYSAFVSTYGLDITTVRVLLLFGSLFYQTIRHIALLWLCLCSSKGVNLCLCFTAFLSYSTSVLFFLFFQIRILCCPYIATVQVLLFGSLFYKTIRHIQPSFYIRPRYYHRSGPTTVQFFVLPNLVCEFGDMARQI